MRRLKISILLFLLLAILHPVSADQWCGIQQLFFQNQTVPEPAGYMVLSDSPSGMSEVDQSVSLTGAGGWVLIKTFISPVGLPNVYTIRKGLRTFNTYHYVNTAAGLTVANYTVFIRRADGREITLYSVSSGDIEATSVTKYNTLYVSPKDFTMLPTDRIGVKVYGMTSGLGPVVLHFVYEGSVHNSNIDTGYFECPQAQMPAAVFVQPTALPAVIPLLGLVLVVLLFARSRK